MKIKSLSAAPRPLYTPENRLALFFSAKAGCTFGIKWFLFQAGQLKAANFYSNWIHRYRTEVFYEAAAYKNNVKNLLEQETRAVKITRNPYSRAVSSFLHAVRTGYDDEGLERFLRRKLKDDKLSFREFVNYLEKINVERCNIHHRLQQHRAEQVGAVVPRIVQLEGSADALPALEQEWSLRKSNLAQLRRSGHHTERAPVGSFMGDFVFSSATAEKSLPVLHEFYDDDLQQRVAKIYAKDFQAYGYDPEVLPPR